MSDQVKLPISVIILTPQGTELLEKILSSVAWADEVILAYTGHSFPEFSRFSHFSRNVRLVDLKVKKLDFSVLRNEAMKSATNEWVFFVDSDEVVQKINLRELESVLSSPTTAGVTVLRKDVFLGKELRWGEVKNVRLIRLMKKSHSQFDRPVHEVAEVDGTVVPSDIVLQHFAHASISSFLQKIIHYTALESNLRLEKGKHFSFWQLLLFPPGKFVYNYIVKLGFLDGWRGFIYAGMMSIHSLSVRAFQYEQKNR